MELYVSKAFPGKGPIAEYQHWQDCETGLTMLVEQLKMPFVKRILDLLEQIHSPIASSFQYFRTELWKHYVEARDNNKFIQTLMRYFKVTITKKFYCVYNNGTKMLGNFVDVFLDQFFEKYPNISSFRIKNLKFSYQSSFKNENYQSTFILYLILIIIEFKNFKLLPTSRNSNDKC